jgi:hypothetical protein
MGAFGGVRRVVDVDVVRREQVKVEVREGARVRRRDVQRRGVVLGERDEIDVLVVLRVVVQRAEVAADERRVADLLRDGLVVVRSGIDRDVRRVAVDEQLIADGELTSEREHATVGTAAVGARGAARSGVAASRSAAAAVAALAAGAAAAAAALAARLVTAVGLVSVGFLLVVLFRRASRCA